MDAHKSSNKNESATESLVQKPSEEKEGCAALSPSYLFSWYIKDPIRRLPFLLFNCCGCLSILAVLIFFISRFDGYIMLGIVSVCIAAYGALNFKNLLALKEQVDKLVRLNQEFRAENVAITQEVDKLQRANTELKGVENDLHSSNKSLQTSLENFQKLHKHLKKLGNSNIKGLNNITKRCSDVMVNFKDSLMKHERTILTKVFDQLELKDSKPDMSEGEFNEFVAALPKSYQYRLKKMGKTFKDFAGDDDIIDYQEFVKLVDEWAQYQAAHGGSTDDVTESEYELTDNETD